MFVLPCFDVVVHQRYLTDGLQQPFCSLPDCYILLGQRWGPPLTILILVKAVASLSAESLPVHGGQNYHLRELREKSYISIPATKYLAIYSGCSDNGGKVVGYRQCTIQIPYRIWYGLFRHIGFRPSWKTKLTFEPTIQIFGTYVCTHIYTYMYVCMSYPRQNDQRYTKAQVPNTPRSISANWWMQRVKVRDKQQTNKVAFVIY